MLETSANDDGRQEVVDKPFVVGLAAWGPVLAWTSTSAATRISLLVALMEKAEHAVNAIV
jgi:hypothetical protein